MIKIQNLIVTLAFVFIQGIFLINDAWSNGIFFNSGFESGPAAVAITGFSASPEIITEPGNTTISWTNENATSCTPSNGTGGWNSIEIDLPNGNTQIEFSTEGIYEFTLTCFGASGQDSSTITVTVTDLTPVCDVTLTSQNVRDWNTLFGNEWPLPVARESRVAVPETGYYAIRFETGDVEDNGAVSTFEASGTAGSRTLSISETAGCFDVVDECKAVGRQTGIGWDTTGTTGECQLRPDTVYYWNVTFTDGVSPSSSTCLGTFCHTYLWVINSD